MAKKLANKKATSTRAKAKSKKIKKRKELSEVSKQKVKRKIVTNKNTNKLELRKVDENIDMYAFTKGMPKKQIVGLRNNPGRQRGFRNITTFYRTLLYETCDNIPQFEEMALHFGLVPEKTCIGAALAIGWAYNSHDDSGLARQVMERAFGKVPETVNLNYRPMDEFTDEQIDQIICAGDAKFLINKGNNDDDDDDDEE